MKELPASVLLVPGLAGLGILRGYLRNRERLHLFGMAHRERMAAVGLLLSDRMTKPRVLVQTLARQPGLHPEPAVPASDPAPTGPSE